MHKIIFITLLLLAGLQHNKLLGQVSMFSSKPLEQNQFCAYTSFKYLEVSKKYDWTEQSWDILADSNRTTKMMLLPMLGYGITDRFSIYVQLPFYEQIKNNNSEFFTGEAIIMSRYAIIPSSSKKTGLTLIGAIRLPTNLNTSNPYIDQSIDIVLGEIFSTRFYNNWRTHIKSEFWFNTNNSDNENPGDQFRLMLKQDYKWRKLKFYLTNQYFYQGKKKDVNSIIIENTQKHMIAHTFGVDIKATNSLLICPKVQVPSYGQGGSLFNEKVILDLVYYFN